MAEAVRDIETEMRSAVADGDYARAAEIGLSVGYSLDFTKVLIATIEVELGRKKIFPGAQPAAENEESAKPEEGFAAMRRRRHADLAAFQLREAEEEQARARAWADEAKRADDAAREAQARADRERQKAADPGKLPTVVGKGTGLILVPKEPTRTARQFYEHVYWSKQHQAKTLYYWHKSFWEWTEGRWAQLDDDTIRHQVYSFLERSSKDIGKIIVPFNPTPDHVNKTIDALKAIATIRVGMPAWLGEEGYDPMDLVACRNGILIFSKRRKIPLSPKFWSPNILEFAYEPEARGPRFERFLVELWAGDRETQLALLEVFGLCLTDETKYQNVYVRRATTRRPWNNREGARGISRK
jgi:phage/plasmid-associated DNA primase